MPNRGAPVRKLRFDLPHIGQCPHGLHLPWPARPGGADPEANEHDTDNRSASLAIEQMRRQTS